MTATERRYGKNSDNIISMNDPDIYGSTFSHLSFKDAIEQQIISDYEIIATRASSEEVEDLWKNNSLIRRIYKSKTIKEKYPETELSHWRPIAVIPVNNNLILRSI